MAPWCATAAGSLRCRVCPPCRSSPPQALSRSVRGLWKRSCCPRPRFARSRGGSRWRISTTRRKTRSLPRRTDGFTWSVHRPHTIVGKAVGNAMKWAPRSPSMRRSARKPGARSAFPASRCSGTGLTDMTDASLLGRHLVWAATTPSAATRTSKSSLAIFSAGSGCGSACHLVRARTCGLRRHRSAAQNARWPRTRRSGGTWRSGWPCRADITRLVSPWHTDADLGRPIEVVSEMSKSRRLGFLDYQRRTRPSAVCFESLRADRLHPLEHARKRNQQKVAAKRRGCCLI